MKYFNIRNETNFVMNSFQKYVYINVLSLIRVRNHFMLVFFLKQGLCGYFRRTCFPGFCLLAHFANFIIRSSDNNLSTVF